MKLKCEPVFDLIADNIKTVSRLFGLWFGVFAGIPDVIACGLYH